MSKLIQHGRYSSIISLAHRKGKYNHPRFTPVTERFRGTRRIRRWHHQAMAQEEDFCGAMHM